MTLATARAAAVHQPVCTVTLDGRLITTPVVSCRIEHGFDTPVATAEVVFAADITGLQFGWRRQEVQINLGWLAPSDGPFYARAFTGIVQVRDRDPAPYTNVLHAVSRLDLVRDGLDTDATFEDVTGAEIHEALLVASGVQLYSLDDEPNGAVTLGTVAPIVLESGTSPLDLLDRINEAFGMAVFDSVVGWPMRRRVSGLPAQTGRVTRSKSNPDFLRLHRREDISSIYDRVVVIGRPEVDGDVNEAGAEAETALVPRTRPLIISTDILQTTEECQESADILIQDVSRTREEVEYEVVGDPTVNPAQTEGLTWAELWTGTKTYFVRRVRHDFGPSGFFTTITAVGGEGASDSFGELEPPVAQFTHRWYKFDGSDPDSVDPEYIVECTDESFDPDGTIVSRSWTNDVGDNEGSTGTSFTVGNIPITTPLITITLTVTDNDTLPDTESVTIDLTQGAGGEDGTPPPDDGSGGGTVPVTAVQVLSLIGVTEVIHSDALTPPSAGYTPALAAAAPMGYTKPAAADWVSYTTSGSAPTGTFWARQEFTLTAGVITSAVLQYSRDDVAWVYINGTKYGTASNSSGIVNSTDEGWHPERYLHPGVNTLHFKVVNTVNSSGHALAFQLDVA